MAEDIEESEAKDSAYLALSVLHGIAWVCDLSSAVLCARALWALDLRCGGLSGAGSSCGRALHCTAPLGLTGSCRPQVFPLGCSWGRWADGSNCINVKDPFVSHPGGCGRYSLIPRMSPSKLSSLLRLYLRDRGHFCLVAPAGRYQRKAESNALMSAFLPLESAG